LIFTSGEFLLGKANGGVGRAVINENDFAIAIALVRKSAQANFEKPFTAPVNNDNTDLVVLFSTDHALPRRSPKLGYFFRLVSPPTSKLYF
jgi:hypothetical protein